MCVCYCVCVCIVYCVCVIISHYKYMCNEKTMRIQKSSIRFRNAILARSKIISPEMISLEYKTPLRHKT